MSEDAIFKIQHDPFTRIKVTLEPQPGKGSLVVSVYRTGEGGKPEGKPQRIRYANPRDITTWFAFNSKANTEAWADKWHKAGVKLEAVTHNIEAEVKPRLVPEKALVPYHSQRDNDRYPTGTCNVTSYAMWLDYYDLPTIERKYDQIEDNLELYMREHNLSRHAHGDLVKMARAHGLDASFDTNVTLDEMREKLARGWGLVVSGTFTKSGHIICVYGTRGQDFLVNDPWGNYNATDGDGRHYRFPSGHSAFNGAHLIYREATMQRVLIDSGPAAVHGCT